MTDLRLDSAGDLDVSGQRASLVEGAEGVRQQIALRLALSRGEWFLDLEAGTPWREDILVRDPELARISAILRARILTCPGVIGLASFTLAFTLETGELRLDFRALTEGGAVEQTAQGADLESLLLALLLQPIGGIL